MRTILQGLVGNLLTSITFPPDYIQLHFNNSSTLNVYSKWRVKVDGIEHVFPTPGTRDAICSLLNLRITEVLEEVDKTSISLSTGATIEILTGSFDYKHEAFEYWDQTGKSYIHEK